MCCVCVCVSVRTGTHAQCSAGYSCLLYPAVTEMFCCTGPLEEGCAVREASYIINIKCEIMTAFNVLHLFP